MVTQLRKRFAIKQYSFQVVPGFFQVFSGFFRVFFAFKSETFFHYVSCNTVFCDVKVSVFYNRGKTQRI